MIGNACARAVAAIHMSLGQEGLGSGSLPRNVREHVGVHEQPFGGHRSQLQCCDEGIGLFVGDRVILEHFNGFDNAYSLCFGEFVE